ncbi:uncharacterized protein LOC119650266 [Hermetia illucens]|uniref:uncharacterized protein LOC119650266 n=1 Tax=Hermetia illucens TaxID=343691 RepID=UPI0018CC59E4|nr:uncharacterized protein LOC119650266 [Hermetia illucens]
MRVMLALIGGLSLFVFLECFSDKNWIRYTSCSRRTRATTFNGIFSRNSFVFDLIFSKKSWKVVRNMNNPNLIEFQLILPTDKKSEKKYVKKDLWFPPLSVNTACGL